MQIRDEGEVKGMGWVEERGGVKEMQWYGRGNDI